MASSPVIVFDLGGVLIDWNPRHLYRKLFDDEAMMERFLADVCAPAWNAEQDRGRTWADAIAELSARYPDYRQLIEAYRLRWEEMLAGPIQGVVDILTRLKADGRELHALTNWSAETFPIARQRYEFLDCFETILVSGEEGLIKPDPAIFALLLARIDRPADACVFIDDSSKNVEAAAEMGFDAIRYLDPETLADELGRRGLPT